MSIRAALNPINNSIRTESVYDNKFQALKRAKDLVRDLIYDTNGDIIEIHYSSIELGLNYKEVITYTNGEVSKIEVIEI